ncbi:hypothetical protein RclHR1_04300007 [Rhizophagus clarus]|uniref:Sel1-like repeat protein n=1 Tax=Rhizophagus clarus TaxID=94130 RepID=A0A2Z6RTW3_9GLOM|nr:hypothetical protein RclHR1_04300007 [Rhizophagus clarus]GES72703.1 Sel1-like repeat protein [Rhizophagus clarus]
MMETSVKRKNKNKYSDPILSIEELPRNVTRPNENKFVKYNLGRSYQYGNGVKKDEGKAFELYKELAEQGYSNAQNKLGYCYEGGIGTKKDLEKAIYWYQRAAKNQNKFSQYHLGRCYEFGNGIEKDEVKAFEWYRKSAEQGYYDAQNELGYLYESGVIIEKDLEKAVYWYQKAAEKGNKFSQYNLGICYQYGNGIEKDEAKAFEWYKKSAEQEYSDAQIDLGYFYESGVGTEKNFKNAVYWYQKAAENGNKIGQYNLGRCYENGIGVEKDVVRAFEWYRKSAEQGYDDAQNELGYFYESGLGTEEDLIKAIYWYQKAAENGNKLSQYNLGFCYQYGNGIEQDETRAFEWYMKSAEQEYSDAQIDLGYFYENGIGTEKNYKKAIYWYRKAAENGNKIGLYNLGRCYENGIGVEKDEVEAFEWYKKSAERKYNEAQNVLGYCYENGIGTVKDLIKALYWYHKAAENGSKTSQHNLGMCYQHGIGIEKDEVKAFEWYKKSAEQGHSDAQIDLGYFYENGIGIEKDLKKSFFWYQKAAENGNKIGQYNLGSCYQYGIGIEKDEAKAFEWYKKSAEQKHSDAQIDLGYLYECGIGTAGENIEKSIYWYQQAAENGNSMGQYYLARCYEYGIGVKKDEFKALEWYEASAKKTTNALGYYDMGTEKNLKKAILWHLKAAKDYNKFLQYSEKDEVQALEWCEKYAVQERSDAQNELGYFYENGIGMERDLEKSIYWYQKAAENGNIIGQYNLGRCYQFGIGVKKDRAKAFEWYKKSVEREFIEQIVPKKENPDGILRLTYYDNGIGTSINKKKTSKFNNTTIIKKLSQNFITSDNNLTSIKTVIILNKNLQKSQRSKLNHSLLLNGRNIQLSNQVIYMQDNELNISLYNGQPTIYININDPILFKNSFMDNNNPNNNNTIQPFDACINFPIARVTYKDSLLESLSNCKKIRKLHNHFLARKITIGGKLFIKNLDLATSAQIDVLKFYLFCTYTSAKYSVEIPFNNTFSLNLLPKIITIDGEELNSHEKLVKWMNNLYQEEEKNITIISYDDLIPVSRLKKRIISSVDDIPSEMLLGIANFKEKLSLEEWVGDVVNYNLASLAGDFQLFHGLTFDKNYEMETSKRIAIDFLKFPTVNQSEKSSLQIIKPSSQLEVILTSNSIYSIKNLNTIPFIKSNVKSYEGYTHVLVKCEQYEILLNKDNTRPTKEFEISIDKALNSMKPLKALQDIFNEHGQIFPQKIILGKSLKTILPISSSSDIIDIRAESFEPHLDKLNISYFLTSEGKIIEKSDLSNWIQNPNDLEIIEFDEIIPLYKILKEEQQSKIENILKNNVKILMTGITDLKDLDNNRDEHHKRINIGLSLEDENYEVFGSIISKNDSELEGIYVNFGSYDFNGFFAIIKKLEETSIVIKECYILWMIVQKPSELLVYSPSNREFQVECIKESIILRSDKSDYYIETSFPLSQGYTIFVHAYCPLTNYEPDNIIKLVKWSHNYIIFQITKSTYNESNDDIEENEAINLNLNICVLCSDHKSLKIDNQKDGEYYSLNSIGYILINDNFNNGNQ